MSEKKIIEGFIHRKGVHCTSSALRNILEFNGMKMSEAMVFGLGGGMGMGYLNIRGQDPMIGGRQNNFEKNLTKLLDINLKIYRTNDREEGWERLKMHLIDHKPVAINIDMAYLPYHDDLPSDDFHFGMHTIVVCGYNQEKETVFIADTGFEEIQEITVEALTAGRNSKYNKWLDPNNFIYEFDFTNKYFELKDIIPKAVSNNGKSLLKSGRFMSIFGIHGGSKGLERFAKDLSTWNELSEDKLNVQCRDISGYISEYGTGGGFFRFLYSKFLHECAEIIEDNNLLSLSKYYEDLGKKWEKLSIEFQNLPNSRNKTETIKKIQVMLGSLIQKEIKGAEKLSLYKKETR